MEDALGKDFRTVQALYLGNWLTDVSQSIDPVAYASGSGKAKESVQDIVAEVKGAISGPIDEFLPTIFEDALKPLSDDVFKELEGYADRAVASLHAQIDFLAAPRSHERDSNLAMFFRDSFLLTGYFKFVHPELPDPRPRMSFACFRRVFGRAHETRGSAAGTAEDRPGSFTQYYPHEHMDRPELLPPRKPRAFAPQRKPGYPPGTRSRNRPPQIPPEPDLYAYLRDDIEMVAGLLAEVDFALRDAFSPENTQGIRDDDPEFHATLAKLGHALHQVEDFFAHSNWVELAVSRMDRAYFNSLFPRTAGDELIDRKRTVYNKRLKRLDPLPRKNWQSYKPEDWVVTGYFDFRDTLISLGHISEELWGGDVADPYATAHELAQAAKPSRVRQELGKLVRDTLAFLTDPQREARSSTSSISPSSPRRWRWRPARRSTGPTAEPSRTR